MRRDIVHVPVPLVLHLQGRNGETIKEENEVDLLIRSAKIEVGAEGDPVLVVFLYGGAFTGAWLRIEQAKLQPAHFTVTTISYPATAPSRADGMIAEPPV